ncbi:hypothetical protein PPROV_000701200 [Pycnococcus provasolii]|uniref:Uncharacterized protein n=1 Tax=Pycnococcus provasolii TaxID=41880 RepID=A0A830HS40_9CHLO|nr:hypothetical protein PPROV_000701200 [Pycnococcus provasolii]
MASMATRIRVRAPVRASRAPLRRGGGCGYHFHLCASSSSSFSNPESAEPLSSPPPPEPAQEPSSLPSESVPEPSEGPFNRSVVGTGRLGSRSRSKANEFDPARLRKFLIEEEKWDKVWALDIVDDIIMGRREGVSVEQTKQVFDWLKKYGLPAEDVCNVVARSHALLNTPTTALDELAKHFIKKGVPGGKVAKVFLHHPALVDYTEAPDGKSLVKGKTVAVVDFTNDKLTCSYNRQQ